MSNVVIDIAAEFTGKKGFQAAGRSVNVLTSNVKKLGYAFGVTFGTRALLQYSGKAIKAFGEQQAETARLAQSVKNLGLQYGSGAAEAYLNTLERITGINRDQLQPAYVKILQTTGSLNKSQEILNQSLDVAAATGYDVVSVSQALSQAYVGNTKGLRALNLGLTKAELASSSFADIQKRLAELFAGQAKIAAATYAAQIGKLSIASENASEVIGKSLIGALQSLSGDKSVDTLGLSIENAAASTANFIDSIVYLKGELASIPGAGILGAIFGFGGNVLGRFSPQRAVELIKEIKGLNKPRGMSTTLTNQDLTASNKAAAIKAEKDAKKRADQIAAQQKAALKLAKDNALLKKASAIFDLAQIQIVAALKGKISEEDRKRLELQMALIGGNADEVVRVANELANVQGKTKELSLWLKDLPTAKNPFQDWMTYLDEIAKKIASLGVPVTGQPKATPTAPPVTNNPLGTSIGEQYASAYQGQAGGIASNLPTVVNIYPQGNVITERDLATMLGASLETASQSGGSGGSWSGVRVL
ncbi:hypothetical protein UFOVP1645_21 [uncultured Caudovirales phage]|uniref:Uncharacterized protein n=1 Tax=uncultured Caudovirales phage TaxID=2100421 RepID=A0A6J5T779_9CAUD|nr:hypothetical protein UFOVP1645_21 [uncultured Caudovirales phage]